MLRKIATESTLFQLSDCCGVTSATPFPSARQIRLASSIASCETTYDDVVVPESDRVGEEGRGFSYLLNGLNAERVLVAAEATGALAAVAPSPNSSAATIVVNGDPTVGVGGEPALDLEHQLLH